MAVSSNSTTLPKIDREAPLPSLDDVHGDIWNLYHLLDATVSTLLDMPFERDGKRDHDLDRVAALVRIGRDRAEFVGKYIDEHYAVIRGRGKGEGK